MEKLVNNRPENRLFAVVKWRNQGKKMVDFYVHTGDHGRVVTKYWNGPGTFFPKLLRWNPCRNCKDCGVIILMEKVEI